MVDVSISLVGSNGDEIQLTDNLEFVLSTGVTGFGIPATSVRIDETAGNGGVWRYTKRGVRDLDLPIVVFGADRAEVETRLRRLARLLQDTNGPTRIVARYSDGSSVYLDAHYVGGAETQYGSDATNTFCRWVVQMQAPQPFWEASESQSFTMTAGNTGRGLLPQLTKLRVSSSQSLGVVSVNSSADVDVYPVWTVRGPITGFTASNGSQTFSFNAPVGAGQTITVDTEAGTVVGDNGANRYSLLSSAPKLFPLKPGENLITVSGTDTDSSTFVSCNYALRYEVVH